MDFNCLIIQYDYAKNKISFAWDEDRFIKIQTLCAPVGNDQQGLVKMTEAEEYAARKLAVTFVNYLINREGGIPIETSSVGLFRDFKYNEDKDCFFLYPGLYEKLLKAPDKPGVYDQYRSSDGRKGYNYLVEFAR